MKPTRNTEHAATQKPMVAARRELSFHRSSGYSKLMPPRMKKEKKANEEENEEKKENVPIGKEAVEGA